MYYKAYDKSDLKLRVAKNDIKVFQIVEEQFDTEADMPYYRANSYGYAPQFNGEMYHMEMSEPEDVREYVTLSPYSKLCIGKVYNGICSFDADTVVLNRFLYNNEIVVESEQHLILHYVDVRYSNPVLRLNCVIPAGSHYYKNKYGEYLSEQLKVVDTEPLTVFDVVHGRNLTATKELIDSGLFSEYIREMWIGSADDVRHIADKDISVFKILPKVTIDNEVCGKEEISKDVFRKGRFNIRELSIPECGIIRQGIFSYGTEEFEADFSDNEMCSLRLKIEDDLLDRVTDIILYDQTDDAELVLVKGTIPVGAKYYKNRIGEYICNEFQVDDILEIKVD